MITPSLGEVYYIYIYTLTTTLKITFFLLNKNLKSDISVYRCVAVLGDLIPVRGRHYWEVEVDDGTEFRIGVAYEDTERTSYLGANTTSWCMRHIVSPSR